METSKQDKNNIEIQTHNDWQEEGDKTHSANKDTSDKLPNVPSPSPTQCHLCYGVGFFLLLL